MIDLPYQSFLSGTNLTTFLGNLKWLLFFIAPGLLIFVAAGALEHLIEVIRGLFSSNDKKDDDDYDIDYY